MEVFLLMIVLVFLIAIISSINSKFKASQDNLNKVLHKVEQLQKQLQSFEGREVISSKQLKPLGFCFDFFYTLPLKTRMRVISL